MNSVLITGGTGFFGNGFVKHLLDNELAERICIYSRDEHKQADMRARFKDDERLRFFIGDVRDADRLKRAVAGVDLIVHAAALKRIEVGHHNPDEMLKTNVHGSMNVIDAAVSGGVEKVVYLSTDKAYQPVSPYGYSKAMAESLFLAANYTHSSQRGTKFAVTRYGNVAGSTGSVIPKWRKLIAEGKKIHMTDPSCTRFWMFLHEAIGLVIAAAQNMNGGELIVPDLPAFDLRSLCLALGEENVLLTGLGLWEKKHESMDQDKSSEHARRMSVYELKEALKNVG